MKTTQTVIADHCAGSSCTTKETKRANTVASHKASA